MEIKQVNLSNANRPMSPVSQPVPEFEQFDPSLYAQPQPVQSSTPPIQPISQTPPPEINNPEEKKSFLGTKIMMLKSKLNKLTFQQKFILFLAFLGILGLASLALIYTFILNFNTENPNLDTSFVLVSGQNSVKFTFANVIPLPPEIGNLENPLNGKLLTKAQYEKLMQTRPIAVMIDNHPEARPQSGIEDADIVYETLVEGGATRLMPIYWSKDPDEIGPIRSVRTYFLDWFSEYDGIMYHIGAAYYEGNERIIVPEADAIKYMEQYGIRRSSEGFYRDSQKVDQGIDSEHTAYYSIQQFRETPLVQSWEGQPNFPSLKFKSDAAINERAVTSQANIQFTTVNSESYKIRWLYDKNSNLYSREVGGKKQIERTSGNQIAVKNIIIEQHEYRPLNDDKGRILFTTTGSGKVYIMRDGEVIQGTWEKDSRTSRTKYFDSKGNEVVFNRGKMWVEILAQREGELISKIQIN